MGTAAAILVAASCSTGAGSLQGSAAPHAGDPRSSLDAGADAAAGPRTHFPLIEAPDAPVDFALQPVPGAASLLVLSQHAGDGAARLRRLDGASTALGPLIELPGEQVYGAFDGKEGRFTLLSSNGLDLCVATYALDADAPEARGCAQVSPSAVVRIGDRLALLELSGSAPPPRKATRPAPPKPAPPKPRSDKKSPAKKADPGKGAKKPIAGLSGVVEDL